MATKTSVLIVGGSLNGLTTALLLARRRVPCVVVERHPGTSIQYKFRGISPRSMEVYRYLGVEHEIRSRDLIDDASAYVARVKNLADPETSWQGVPWSEMADVSPTRAATCDQDQLEPILRSHAERLGADIRFNTELIDFTQDADGVTARVRNRATGDVDTIEAPYMIAADGTHSPVREALGIKRHGPGVLQHWMNVIFETDLPTMREGRAIRALFVTDINGSFVPRGDGRWLFAVQYVPERGERPKDFTNERCMELIRRGAGRADVNARIVDARQWEAAALVADRYRDRRVFLVGDSAHVMPPTGGFGGNTGIQDAENLAWKLDEVLRGAADRELLDSYDAERRPVADATVAQALARLQAWFRDPSMKLPPPVPIVPDDHVVFGYRYGTPEMFEDPRKPSAQPGARAPQIMLTRDGRSVSSIDRFAGVWGLLTGPRGGDWTYGEVAVDHSRSHDDWSQRYDLPDTGAVLIRPDGFIAWLAENAGEAPTATPAAASPKRA